MAPVAPRSLILLGVGIVAVSFASILIRLSDAPALSIAFYRNALAAGLVVPLALARHRDEIRGLRVRDWGVGVLAGALLAIHFGVWIPSLSYTTVAASTVLVTSQPIWVVLIGRLSGERVSRRLATGVGLSLAGAALISGGDFGVSARAAVGDLLALLGAVAAAGYYVSGRSLRQRLSLLTYVGIAYTTCAVVLGAAMLASGTAFGGFESTDWLLFGLLALGPQIMGHTVFNYLLGDVEAAVVAVAVTFEPVGASLLALAFFGEVPRWTAFAGGALILAGIYVTVAAQTRRSEVAPVQ